MWTLRSHWVCKTVLRLKKLSTWAPLHLLKLTKILQFGRISIPGTDIDLTERADFRLQNGHYESSKRIFKHCNCYFPVIRFAELNSVRTMNAPSPSGRGVPKNVRIHLGSEGFLILRTLNCWPKTRWVHHSCTKGQKVTTRTKGRIAMPIGKWLGGYPGRFTYCSKGIL